MNRMGIGRGSGRQVEALSRRALLCWTRDWQSTSCESLFSIQDARGLRQKKAVATTHQKQGLTKSGKRELRASRVPNIPIIPLPFLFSAKLSNLH